MKKQFVVEYGRSVLGRSKRRYFDTIPEAEVFTSAYHQRRGVILGIERAGPKDSGINKAKVLPGRRKGEPIDHYANYDREPVKVFDDLTKRLEELGFKKVMYHCVYEGPVLPLIEELKKAGWKKARGHRNPFLLQNPKSFMIINFAETGKKPDGKYLSYF